MADITMCDGTGCALKDKCYRFTAPVNPYRQSYFVKSPMIDNDHCEEFCSNGKTDDE